MTLNEKLKIVLEKVKLQIYAFPVIASGIFLVFFYLYISPENFPDDNARYAYSAIFQGFAAILAIMITAILITLQNIHSQKFAIEERIFKILDNRYPSYIPHTIDQIEKDLYTQVFEEQLRKNIFENLLALSLAQRGLLVKRIIDELKRNFEFLNNQKNHASKLIRFFKVSLGMNIIILVYSLTALLIAVPSDSTSTLVIINPVVAMFICTFLVLIALEMFGFFFIEILKIWNLDSKKKLTIK